MSLPDIKKMFTKLNQEHFNGEIPDIHVVWNNRLRTTAGKCKYRKFLNGWHPTKIEIANRIFEVNGWNLEMVERILVHEMVHAYLITKYDEPGHTRNFHSIMTRITGEYRNHRCHTYDVSKTRNARNVEVFCPKCDEVISMRSRMPRNGLKYIHPTCGSYVIFKRNDVSKGINLGE